MPAGDANSSGQLVPSLWDLQIVYLLRPTLFRTCRYFTGLCSSNIPRYFLDFASKLSGESNIYMKKRRLSAELNWIKRLQTPYPLGLNDQIYQQGNISSIRSNINIFSLKPEVGRKRRSHGVRRNGLSRRKQRLNRSLDDLFRIAKNNGRHELLHSISSIHVSRLKPILDEADRRSYAIQIDLYLRLLWHFRLISSFPAYHHFLLNTVHQN